MIHARTLIFLGLLLLVPAGVSAQSGGCTTENVGSTCTYSQPGDGKCALGEDVGPYCRPNALDNPKPAQTSPTGSTGVTSGSGSGSTSVVPTAPGGKGGINTSYLQGYANSIQAVINNILVPVLTAVAFIVFLWGAYYYFIQGGHDPEKRKTGRMYIIWALIGFVIIFTVWGLVNVLTTTLGLETGGTAKERGLKLPTIQISP
jgi:hypothetical protein